MGFNSAFKGLKHHASSALCVCVCELPTDPFYLQAPCQNCTSEVRKPLCGHPCYTGDDCGVVTPSTYCQPSARITSLVPRTTVMLDRAYCNDIVQNSGRRSLQLFNILATCTIDTGSLSRG